jgi:hypothetical protein
VGVRFISLDLPYSSDMAVNQLISTNLAAMNGGKTDSVRNRSCRKNGKYFGRKPVIDKN